MKPDKDRQPREVFSGTAWQAETVKGMLEDNELEAFFGGEIWGTDAPMNSAPGNAGAVRVFVPQIEYEDARIVVERYYEDMTEEVA
nr:DUF2007 domain-containing protein [Bacteroidota bacterium]